MSFSLLSCIYMLRQFYNLMPCWPAGVWVHFICQLFLVLLSYFSLFFWCVPCVCTVCVFVCVIIIMLLLWLLTTDVVLWWSAKETITKYTYALLTLSLSLSLALLSLFSCLSSSSFLPAWCLQLFYYTYMYLLLKWLCSGRDNYLICTVHVLLTRCRVLCMSSWRKQWLYSKCTHTYTCMWFVSAWVACILCILKVWWVLCVIMQWVNVFVAGVQVSPVWLDTCSYN